MRVVCEWILVSLSVFNPLSENKNIQGAAVEELGRDTCSQVGHQTDIHDTP